MQHNKNLTQYARLMQILLVFVAGLNLAASVCNVCQSNHAACINSTSYYLCFGDDMPYTDVLYHCKEGFDCTENNAICVQQNVNRPPSCGDTSLCGQCRAHRNSLFACLSRTTFRMCYGAATPLGQVGYCPLGYVCDASSDYICVPPKMAESVTCDMYEEPPITSTEASSTTTSTASPPTIPTTTRPLSPIEVCQKYLVNGLYAIEPLSFSCSRYIACYFYNGHVMASEYSCPPGSYFDRYLQQCSFIKPSYC